MMLNFPLTIPPAAIPMKRAEITSLVQKQRTRVRAAGTMDQNPKSSKPGSRADDVGVVSEIEEEDQSESADDPGGVRFIDDQPVQVCSDSSPDIRHEARFLPRGFTRYPWGGCSALPRSWPPRPPPPSPPSRSPRFGSCPGSAPRPEPGPGLPAESPGPRGRWPG